MSYYLSKSPHDMETHQASQISWNENNDRFSECKQTSAYYENNEILICLFLWQGEPTPREASNLYEWADNKRSSRKLLDKEFDDEDVFITDSDVPAMASGYIADYNADYVNEVLSMSEKDALSYLPYSKHRRFESASTQHELHTKYSQRKALVDLKNRNASNVMVTSKINSGLGSEKHLSRDDSWRINKTQSDVTLYPSTISGLDSREVSHVTDASDWKHRDHPGLEQSPIHVSVIRQTFARGSN